MIELINVCKIYKMGDQKLYALDHVNLQISRGEFVAIMGPSGSGKSTLLQIIGLLDRPTEGNFKLFGNEIINYRDNEISMIRRQFIGFIFQQFHLLKKTTAKENVAQPLLYYKSKNAKTEAEVLNTVGLSNRMEHKTNQLSGGQQQRVAIARSLINAPQIIFADEPTGNLDSKSEKEILSILQKLHEEGMTIIMVTHEEHIAKIASRVIRMSDGKIIADQGQHNMISESIQPFEFHPENFFNTEFIIKNIKMAWNNINSNRIRSALSMLGILIGVAAVIAMLAIGRGAQDSIKEEFSALGTRILTINPGAARFGPMRVEGGKITRLNVADVKAIRERIVGVAAITGVASGQARVIHLNNNWETAVLGVESSYLKVQSQELLAGRFFAESEDHARSRLAIIGKTVLKELFGEDNPIGEFIKINGSRFQIIGVLKELGSSGFRDEDDVILIPLQTAMKRLLGKIYLNSIRVKVDEKNALENVENELKNIIIERNKLTADEYDTFNIRNMASFQEAMTGTIKIISILLTIIAAISLFVGGIGIMNIMLVSVTERTREIGLRKAIGASANIILMQFMIEAIIVSLSGGIMGVGTGIFIAKIVSIVFGWNTVVTIQSIGIATFFSLSVGLLFGIWPAKKASALEPIDALRFE